MSEKPTPPETLIGYVYKLSTILGDGQQLEVSGNLAIDAEVADMNRQFDRLITVTNRLAAKHKISAKKAEISADEAMISAMLSDIALLDADAVNKYKDRKMPTAEQNNRDAMVRNIRHLEGRVAGYREDLKTLEEEAK